MLLPGAGLPGGRQLPRLHGGDRRRAGARRELHPDAVAGHEGQHPDPSRDDRTQDGGGAPARRPAGPSRRSRSAIPSVAGDRWPEAGRVAVSRPDRPGAARPQPCRDGGQPRRLHPVQPVRPRLPRSAGQRRHRHGRARPRREDRVRLRRPHGRIDLRRLRRMRPGLPDRRADAGEPRQRPQCPHRLPGPRGRLGLSLLRCRLPAHLSHQGRQAALRHRQGRAGEPSASLREGPVRLRLRPQSAAAHPAAGPQGRRAEAHRRRPRHPPRDAALPPRQLGRGARPRSFRPEEDSRRQGRACARRFRLGQGVERGGLSVPEAGPHRLRLQQCRSLHAAVPCLVGGGADGRRRLRRRDRHLQRVQEFRRHHRDRRRTRPKTIRWRRPSSSRRPSAAPSSS